MNKQEFLETYIADRHNTNCSKWDGLKEKFGEADLLPMWVSGSDTHLQAVYMHGSSTR